ncbi:MAG TPA: PEP-CTERM sorting domain-containing protein [Phycisphaerae bacterium]|nr:PEP-CTERM sorting domain-containing protein [Phycisphaerae bacterium]
MIDLVFHLAGTPPGAGRADLAESIKITNTGDAALDFHFFQYVDLNLSPNDTVSFMNPNTVRQTAGVLVASETVITPAPNHREVALAGITLAKLTDGAPTTLSGNAGPVSGDVTWAFQWDFVIPAKKAVLISKDKQLIVPEPATVLLAALGSLVLSRRRRTV